MVADLRAELTSLRRQHGELVQKYETIRAEHAQLVRERRMFPDAAKTSLREGFATPRVSRTPRNTLE